VGLAGESQEKPKGGLVGARTGGLGGVSSQLIEGLCSVVEGLCGVIEGLYKGWKCDKLLILDGPVGFSSVRPGEIAGCWQKTARIMPMRELDA
jgi:hypothetical protein